MGHWSLTERQAETLAKFIRGQRVVDVLCGDMTLAVLMAKWAYHVVGVDKVRHARPVLPDNVTFVEQDIAKWFYRCGSIDCAVISWPPTYNIPGLLEVVQKAERVVYIGCNTGGTSCGNWELWWHLTTRELVAEARHRSNCLHCYGPKIFARTQFRSEEEVAGLLRARPFSPIGFGDLANVKDLGWSAEGPIKHGSVNTSSIVTA